MARASLLSRIAGRLRREAADFGLLHGDFVKHHVCRLAGKSECEVDLAGFRVVLRPKDSDLPAFRGIFVDHEYDIQIPEAAAAIQGRYEAIIAAGRTPVIVDAGANVGAASLWFRHKFPKSHIVAIEPDEQCCSLLQRNVAGHGPIDIVQAGIGGTPGHVQLVDAPDSWAIQTERADTGTPIVTMNEAFGRVPDGEPFLAKINIEGFEEDVFSANLEWLDRIAVLYLEPHDWRFPGQHTSRTFQKAMGERDFHLFLVGNGICYVRM